MLVRRGAKRHPVNVAMDQSSGFGQRIADRLTGFMGNWSFIEKPILGTLRES